jgi:hypothetical protein
MARRQSKRIDLPDFMTWDTDLDDYPGNTSLKLEIALRKGAVRDYPFTSEVRSDLAKFLNLKIGKGTWYKINAATARYVLRVAHFYGALPAVTVQTVCRELVEAIDNLQHVYNKNAKDPRVAAFLREMCVDIGIRHTEYDRKILMRQIERCADNESIASGPGWDEWIRDLAKICPEIGIVPSGEGPDRSVLNQSSTFVRLISRLQAELPEICAQHESDTEASDASFARSVRRALSHGTRTSAAKNGPNE